MSAASRHKDVIDTVESLIKTNISLFPPFRSSDVQVVEFSTDQYPSYGIIISPATDREVSGLNDQDDIVYPVRVTRMITNNSPSDGIENRSKFFIGIRSLFNHRRIGVTVQEVITRTRSGSFTAPKEWSRNNLDVSVMIVETTIREPRT